MFALVQLSSADLAQDKALAQARERQFDHAILTKNFAFFDHYAAADFTEVSASGKTMDRAAALAQIKAVFGQAKPKVSRSRVTKVTRKGKVVSVYVSSYMVVMLPSKGGKFAKLVDRSSTVESWTKERDGWKIHRVVTKKETASVNGKAVPQD